MAFLAANDRATQLKLAVTVFLGVFICAWGGIEITRGTNWISSIWPANAFLLAFLLKTDSKQWPALAASALLGNIIAHLAHHDDLGRSFFLPPIGTTEVLVLAALLRKFAGRNFSFDDCPAMRKFFLACFILPVFSATTAALYFLWAQNIALEKIFLNWYLAETLGLIIFTPAFHTLGWKTTLAEKGMRGKAAALMACLILTLSATFLQNSYPLLFLVFPIMALTAFTLGTSGAVLAIAVTAIFSIACTIQGYGPIALVDAGIAEKSFVLQGFLSAIVLISLPMAANLAMRQKLEVSLKDAIEVAEKANLAKSQFLTSMSHELRTPLNAILGFSQLLQMDKSLDGKIQSHIKYVMAGGEHLLKLITEILDFSKIESGSITIDEEVLSCDLVLDEVIELIRPLAENKGIKIETCFVPGLRVTADRSRIMQVMVNLLSNAIKYNREGGVVTVTSESIGDMVSIKITDTGIGIPLEKQHGVFEAFNRLGAENSDIEGTGIGLAISKELMSAMQGRIGFRSVQAEGSTFYIEIPQSSGNILEKSAFQLPKAQNGKTPKRILYIEDNLANAELMRNVIENFINAEITIARDGRSGLRKAREVSPDLIISDIHLPDMTGDDVLVSLRNNPLTSHIPVMALTADATYLSKQEAKAFDNVMSKPFQLSEFAEKISLLLQPLSKIAV